MASLHTSTLRELIELLSPILNTEGDRRTLVETALGPDFPGLNTIEWTGAAESFVLRLVVALADAGEVQPGTQALWQVLLTAREKLGSDRQAHLDALEAVINRPPGVAAAPTAGAYPQHLRVFLASPGDVADERALAVKVLDQLPYDPLLRGRVTVEAVAWDQPGAGVPMLASMTPQAAVAAGLPKPSQCDIVIVIFWSRMGTPLPEDYRKPDGSAYLSGSEWEYLDALEASRQQGRPEVLVYRRTEKCLLDQDDPEYDEKRRQYALVKSFFAAFRNPDGSIRSGCNEYPAPEDFRKQLDAHLRSIIRRLLDSAPVAATSAPAPKAATPVPRWQGSPFPGLRAFTPLDAPIYFGRGRETDELVRRLATGERFLVVVGASGSGKSSLVAAGLLPRLKDNAIAGAKDWLLPQAISAGAEGRAQWLGLRFTPGELGDNPFIALAAKLAPLLPDEANTAALAAQLEAKPESIAALAADALAHKPAWSEAFLFVDQFEELFTGVAEGHRTPFLALLATAARAPRLRVVATLRADFYHRCVERPELAELLRTASFPLAAPGLGALFEMITGPAAYAGLSFEPGLPARILDDTGADPGALALLAFALHELYEARGPEGRLTLTAYDSFGGVPGAISARAEKTFARLPAESQVLLPAVFRDLVDVDERGVPTRRRAHKLSCPEAAELVASFTNARLLVTGAGPDGAPIVEVAHEALLREWKRLAKWIAECADDLRTLRQVEAAAAEWRSSGCDASHLWLHERQAPVYEALARLGMTREQLDEPAKSFLRPEAERLQAELEDLDTSHYRRAEIGDRLDRIGDPRPGVGLRPDGLPDIVWCDVPGGRVELEEGAGGFQVEAFRIAKYPVTYRQYQAFLDDPQGYRDQRWWKGLDHDKDPGEQYRPIGNCPADTASWYDTMAFCRWLDATLRERAEVPDGWQVRLPTEQEWQQAATGGDAAREYPWPGEWDERRANSSESRLGRTTSVGMYPAGASQGGALDMAGNVWEWCDSFFEAKDHAKDGPRVLRGGSWDGSRGGCRCAVRDWVGPDDRGGPFGFRVCCAPPIS